MREVCSFFIDCLSSAGGPAKEEAIALDRDWQDEVFKNCQVFFCKKVRKCELSPVDEKLALELKNLHKEYAMLITNITTYYASCKKYDVIIIARWVQIFAGEAGLVQDDVTVDKIFERIYPHHSFIDIDIINDLVEAYPIDDSELQTRFDLHQKKIDRFINSTKINAIVTNIKEAMFGGNTICGESTQVDHKMTLKLSGKWSEQTVGHLRVLLKFLFNEDAKYITIKNFSQGSICIHFLVFSNRLVQPLIKKSQNKSAFLHLLGIFQLIIDDHTIIDKNEDSGFTFEESLLQSITRIKDNLEYQRLALLLIKLEINLSSNNGQTALMLAMKGGHIEVFKLLLENGANPFVQQADEEYITLNHLACNTLSQHVYKSTDEKKIIPRDTSVEDILKVAAIKRGPSSYEPFVSIIKNKLKERFQLLKNQFDALNSNFLNAATNILTTKSMVTAEAKQNFQSYIKDSTDKNADQLVQLLQPHYSCLNINLLTIPCTITEPIKEQVEEYNTNLKMFKDTTSLLELAMITTVAESSCEDSGSSRLILKLNKQWCSRTITDLNKMENSCLQTISKFLTLQGTCCDVFSLTCTYRIPQLQTPTMEEVIKQEVSLFRSGVFEVIVNDISIIMKDKDTSFAFETDVMHDSTRSTPSNAFNNMYNPYYLKQEEMIFSGVIATPNSAMTSKL